MRHPWVLLLALAVGSPAAVALEVVHDPVRCVPPGRYARVVASASPPEAVASAEAHFRTGPTADWYRVRLDRVDGAWQGFLPRPNEELTSFEYRVSLRGSDAAEAATEPVSVSVSGSCPPDGSSGSASMEVRVPPGAPLVPPVPAGFNPVGAAAPAEARRAARTKETGGRGKALLIGGGLVGAAGAGVAVAAAGRPRAVDVSDQNELPHFTFQQTVPPPGTTLSRSRDNLQVWVNMDHEPRFPVRVDWFVEFLAGESICAVMTGVSEGVQRPLGLVLQGRVGVFAAGTCGTGTFDTTALRVSMTVDGVSRPGQPIPAPFRLEP
ncbi:MAG: hypothetical protein ABW221_14175 [Vicinamibacteria bacterium]